MIAALLYAIGCLLCASCATVSQNNTNKGDTTFGTDALLRVENLGNIGGRSNNSLSAAEPISSYETKEAANLLIGRHQVSLDSSGQSIRNISYDTGLNTSVTAVHSLASNNEAAFVAIAQETSDGSGGVVSIFEVVDSGGYKLFSRVQTAASVKVMKLYKNLDGKVMMAIAQRVFNCTAALESECGMSLVYELNPSGAVNLPDLSFNGTAAGELQVVEGQKGLSLMYSTCETAENGTQSCQLINRFERPGMKPQTIFKNFSCDPSGATTFNVKGETYFIGPIPTCDGHHISMWNEQLDFANTFSKFDHMPEKWFVVNTGYQYCNASLIVAGSGPGGTTYYALDSPTGSYTTLLQDPSMNVVAMWGAGGNVYCVNKSNEALTLFRMSCPNSYVDQQSLALDQDRGSTDLKKSEPSSQTTSRLKGIHYEDDGFLASVEEYHGKNSNGRERLSQVPLELEWPAFYGILNRRLHYEDDDDNYM